jgi:uncharacterized protein YqkB
MSNKILSSPLEVLQHIERRLVEDRFAHITVNAYENKGDFVNWINQAKLWYDPNVCGCKKKGLNENIVIQHFKNLKSLNSVEKQKAYKIIGESVKLRYQDEVILTLP